MECAWLKDADTFGQQDPYIKWMFRGKPVSTSVKDGAGTHAVFHESFELEMISDAVLNGEEVVFESWDKDVVVDDHLGSSRPMMWQDFVQDEEVHSHTLDLYDRKNAKAGALKFETQFTFVPEINEEDPMSPAIATARNVISLWKGNSS